MNHETAHAMRDGACLDLPHEVVDKYFAASPAEEPFEHQTAKAICRHCAAQTVCLEDAISSPAVYADSVEWVRGGEAGIAIQALRRRHFLLGEPADALAAEALQRQASAPTVSDIPQLRQGQFADAELAVRRRRE